MQAQRKFDDVAREPMPDRGEPRAIEADLSAWDAAIAASPARRLHQELIAHFEQGAAPSAAAAPMAATGRWPMPVRLSIILGGSAALWIAIGIGALAII